jgi:serine/threonine protein kinase
VDGNGTRTEVGRGASAVLYLCLLFSRQEEIVVKYFYQQQTKSDIYKEAEQTWLLSASGVTPEFHGILMHEGRDFPALVISYIGKNSRTARDFIRMIDTISIEEKCRVATEIAGSIRTLHRQGFFHGDLKPENIMINEIDGPIVTLLDLGQTSSITDPYKYALPPALKQYIGRQYSYIAPELIDGGDFTTAADIFAFGDLLEKTVNFGELPTWCKNPNPKMRPSIEEVVREIHQVCFTL